MATTCSRCGAKKGIMGAFTADLASDVYTCPDCTPIVAAENRQQESEKRQQEEARLTQLRYLAAKVLVTTTNGIDGFVVTKYLGIESVEFVIGTGVFSEITTDFQDFFGKRSTAFESKLQAAKKAAFEAFTMLAAEKGANAIIGVDIDYTEFSGNRIGLVLNGTLVRIAPAQ